MNRTHLAAFRAVAEAGSFVRGATAIGVGQPVLSSHVADLERALGTALFERLPRGVRPTEAGQTLLRYAQRIAAMEDDAEQAIAALRGLRAGRLRLGASTTVAAHYLPRFVAAFHREHPGVNVTLAIGNTREVQARLIDAESDVAVTEGFVGAAGLTSEIVFADALVLIAPPAHPLARRRRVTARDVAALPVILREPGSGTRAVAERAFARRRVTLNAFMSIASTEAIKQSVIAGLGVALVSRLAIAAELSAGTLVAIEVADVILDRPLHLMTVDGRPPSAATRAFSSLLRRDAKAPRRKR